MNKELAKTLTTALVQFIDRERPEGSVCCSSYECERIEKAFESDTYDALEAIIKKKLLDMTGFELEVSDIVEYCKKHGEHVAFDYAKRHAKHLLALAKKELVRQGEVITLDNLSPYDKGFQDGKAEAMADLERTFECNPDKLPGWLKDELAKKHLEGYTLGKEDAMRDMRDFLKSHFHSEEAKGPNPPAINVPTWTPPCYNGGPCTNPFHDCINCPRSNMVISPNTASGTSTLKAEG